MNQKTPSSSAQKASIPPKPEVGPEGFPIVGIGASAGGLDAFTELLQELPEKTGLAFVLIQHLSPDHSSSLPDILSRTTSLPVQPVENQMPVEVDQIYVIAPNTNVVLKEGVLHVSPRDREESPHLPINTFFESLAHERKSQAIGVILSGTASDGTQGMKTIKAEGGITFAQDESAKYPGMPRSAVATDCVDYVLPPEDIARELVRIGHHLAVRTPRRNFGDEQEADSKDKEQKVFLEILKLLKNATGVDFLHYKHPTLRRRIGRRMILLRQESLQDYLDLLCQSPAELNELYNEVLIQVTSFFRDPKVYDAFKKDILPRILKDRREDQPIRIWVPACSSGEEVYSVAICLLEYLENRAQNFSIKIFATDISEDAINKGRAAIYDKSIEHEVSPERLRRFFVQVDRGYQINKSVRDLCVFAKHDLTRDPPFSQLDLVSCRNVLIYLDTPLQRQVLPFLHYALKPGGILILGGSETIGSFQELFSVVDGKCRFYARKAGISRLSFDFAFGTGLTVEEGARNTEGVHHQTSPELQREADQFLLAKYAPAGILVNEDLQIIQFRGQTGAYLEQPPGPPSCDLQRMAREGLLPELRVALNLVKKKGLPVRREGVRVRVNNHFRRIHLEVIPLRPAMAKELYYLVLFEEIPSEPEVSKQAKDRRKLQRDAGAAPDWSRDNEVAHLKQELQAAKDYLHSVTAKHDAVSEELKASNEELISSNEELQSTNEELETAKEELQSTNEELTTVNDELHTRIQQANQLNDDLANLVACVNIPIVMLGQDLRIRRFSPSAQRVLNLISSDIGRHIGDFKPKINIPDLEPLLLKVLETLEPEEREVRDQEGRWYSMLIRPYRTQDNKIDGTVLAFIDVDIVKQREQQTTRDYAVRMVESIPNPLLLLDQNLQVRTANPSFYRMFRLTPEGTERHPVDSLGDGRWNLPGLRDFLNELHSPNMEQRTSEFEQEFPGLGRMVLQVTAQCIESPPGESEYLILVGIEDITKRKQAETRSKKLNKTLQERTSIAEKQSAQLRALTAELTQAEQRERRRLAKVLHDHLQQLLVAAKLTLGRIDRKAEQDPVRETLSQVDELLNESIEASRSLTVQLSPPVLYESGLSAGLEWLARWMQEKHGLTVEIDVDPQAEPEGDELRLLLFESVRELLFNIVKHAQVEQASLSMNTDDQGQLQIRIVDRGVGFDPAQKKFSHASGSGLGLFSLDQRLQSLGGRLEIESAPGQGTCMVLHAPRSLLYTSATDSELSLQPKRKATEPPLRRPGGPIRVLLVDDHRIVREGLAGLLRGQPDLQVVGEASNGQMAIDLAHELHPDVVVMDITMPGMNGIKATRQIKAELPHVQVIGLSLHEKEDMSRDMRAAGAFAYLTKGGPSDDLIAAIRAARSESPESD